MRVLEIELIKEPDGSVNARYLRPNGTVAWQRHRGDRAAFFPRHDLVHFAVEMTLALKEGFYGMLAQGWELAEMDGKQPRGPLPTESILTEHLVNLLSTEFSSPERLGAAEVNALMAGYAQQRGDPRMRDLTDADLTAIRVLLADLTERWRRLPSGGALALRYAVAG